MIEKFLIRPPLARRAITAATLSGLMVIDLAFQKGHFTVFGFLLCSIGFVWAIGMLRPFLFLLFLLFKAVFRIKTSPC
ncbi:hypothetical protein VOM14_20330 [Paraburkholderia sp. MPAMCS5]|uniref:hypothetical protein n=1 Tax=Paraburkholderia sp. MPAMCS5 TaxID=3112563 RepID=UPI002E18C061|nr:hypothetical protein [Paraburkholderia sp. MPAMCS5]